MNRLWLALFIGVTACPLLAGCVKQSDSKASKTALPASAPAEHPKEHPSEHPSEHPR
jgi:hypothetical protein